MLAVVRACLVGCLVLGSSCAARAQFQFRVPTTPAAYNAGVGPAVFGMGAIQGFASMSSVGAAADAALLSAGALSPYAAGLGGLGGAGYGMVNLGVTNMGNLYGSSAVVSSLDQFMLATQQARFMREQVRQERIANRRRVLEQWLWERANLPTPQDESVRLQRLQLRRSQNEPPATEIFAGRSLNDLLVDAQQRQGQGAAGQDVPLGSLDLNQINFAPVGGGAANAGLLKQLQNDQSLRWPVGLRGEEYEQLRGLLTSLVHDALRQTRAQGRADAGTIQEMNRTLDQFGNALRNDLTSKDLAPAVYNPARSFLDEMGNAVRALGEPDAKRYLNGQYAAQGKTAAELVNDMKLKGLAFAPAASPGQQPAYLALHRALAAYDISLNTNAGLTTEPRADRR